MTTQPLPCPRCQTPLALVSQQAAGVTLLRVWVCPRCRYQSSRPTRGRGGVMRYEYQDAEALAGDDFWALCNQLGADGWRLMDRRDYEMGNGRQWTIGVFERVTVAEPA